MVGGRNYRGRWKEGLFGIEEKFWISWSRGSERDGGQVGLGAPSVLLGSLWVKGQGWHGTGAQGHQVGLVVQKGFCVPHMGTRGVPARHTWGKPTFLPWWKCFSPGTKGKVRDIGRKTGFCTCNMCIACSSICGLLS